MSIERYSINGTGGQAPYGTGEIIRTSLTARQALKAIRAWHCRPSVYRMSDGARMRVVPISGDKDELEVAL